MKNKESIFPGVLVYITCVLAIVAIFRTCTHEPKVSKPVEVADTTFVEKPYVETRSPHKLDKATAISIIKSFEGYRDTVYNCPNGVPTVGYGTTKACMTELYRKGYLEDSFYVWGDTMTKPKADLIVSKTVDMIYAIAKANVPDLKYLSPKAQAAFVSWAYQCGIGSQQKKTGILGVFPDIAEHVDDKMLYDILVERAFYGKYKARRLKEAAVIIGVK